VTLASLLSTRLPQTLYKVIRGFVFCTCSPICRRRGCSHAHHLPSHWTAAPASEALHDCAQENSASTCQLVRRPSQLRRRQIRRTRELDLEKRCPTDTNVTSSTSFARAWWMRTWTAMDAAAWASRFGEITSCGCHPSSTTFARHVRLTASPRGGFNVDGAPLSFRRQQRAPGPYRRPPASHDSPSSSSLVTAFGPRRAFV
jgi:hypothetical protein